MTERKVSRVSLAAGFLAATLLTAGAVLASAAGASPAAVVAIGAVTTNVAAPQFTATDATGKSVRLSDFAGKTVVLEWTNHGCPFVVKHYDSSGNIPALQAKAREEGVVWLSVISSAPGKQGYLQGQAALAKAAERNSVPHAILLDPDGALGRQFGAKTTPHMFVIDGKGVLRYQGGIDSIKSANAKDIAKAEPYVANALAAIKAGQPVSPADTTPYGCGVKY
jgi:peroxiredoxin